MKLSEREQKFLEAILEYSEELAKIDGSRTVKLLREEGFPVEGLETVKKRTGLAPEQDIIPSLKERGLLEQETRKEKRTITEPDAYGFQEEEVDYLMLSEELLEWLSNQK